MAGTFIPPRDADALVQLQAFSINISAAYGSYGLGKPDADTIASVVGQFAAAFAAASNPATRTPGAVNLKAHAASRPRRSVACPPPRSSTTPAWTTRRRSAWASRR